MADMTIEEMRAAVAEADSKEMAEREAARSAQQKAIADFNADPMVAELQEKLATLEGIEGTAAHLFAIRTGLAGLGTLG